MKLLTRAASSGYVEAQVLLGYLAASEESEEKDFAEALAWLKLAAKRGNKAAIYGAEKLEKLMEVEEIIQVHRLAQKYRSFAAPTAPAPIIAGAQDTRDPDEILREAAAAGDTKTVQLMLARGADPNALDATGRSALINAAWRGRQKIVQLMLEKGADLTILDRDGMSAVNWAAVNCHDGVIQLLAAEGANLNNRDNDGLTPLMRASWNGHAKAVAGLLNQGANQKLRDRSGKSALDFARREGYELIQRILQEAEES